MTKTFRLTEFSHGAGCGCKIAPAVLETILAGGEQALVDEALIVGNSTKDDAAAYDLGNGEVVLSTTDFFMPIADDAHDFGRIAAANAISDIYAMGGTPLMAIAILGWPLDLLPAELAGKVIAGGRATCEEAGIVLAGGHSIDAPEPIFGLAVTGRVRRENLRQNAAANAGDVLYLTKPLGIGILTTAQKQKILKTEHAHLARDWMCRLNRIGTELAGLSSVSAMTDVTGFGLAGHLIEMCEASNVSAVLEYSSIPVIEAALDYLQQGAIPGGTSRNFDSYGTKIGNISDEQKHILCDPQTSGGLLVAVKADATAEVEILLRKTGIEPVMIGKLRSPTDGPLIEVVS